MQGIAGGVVGIQTGGPMQADLLTAAVRPQRAASARWRWTISDVLCDGAGTHFGWQDGQPEDIKGRGRRERQKATTPPMKTYMETTDGVIFLIQVSSASAYLRRRAHSTLSNVRPQWPSFRSTARPIGGWMLTPGENVISRRWIGGAGLRSGQVRREVAYASMMTGWGRPGSRTVLAPPQGSNASRSCCIARACAARWRRRFARF